jgi:hypothetical protein
MGGDAEDRAAGRLAPDVVEDDVDLAGRLPETFGDLVRSAFE